MAQRARTWVGERHSSSFAGGSPPGTPLPVVLACAGLGAITAIVLGAIGIRGVMSGGAAEPERAAPAATSGASPTSPRAPEQAASGDAVSVEARRALRSAINKDLQSGRFGDFITHLEQLLDIDPSAAEDRDIRGAIVDVVLMRIMVGGGDEKADKMFALLQHRMGTVGIDILYELVTTRGSSLASKRAAELLRDESVRARGTPALRAAYGLRTAPCEEKRRYFEGARTDGDKRALDQLQPLNQECGRRNRGGCCLRDDPELKAAIAALKARLP